MPSILIQKIITNLKEIVKSHKDNTGPTIREKYQNLTISYNIYDNLTENWLEIKKILETIFESKNLTPLGEIITHNGSGGKIIDQGNLVFKVIKSNIWECYFYESETFLYIRLLWEQDFQKPERKNWISLDIDLLGHSAWFNEASRKKL